MNVEWNEFECSVNGMNITVKWWPKDFVAYYESQFGTLEYGFHIPAMCPKKYSEEVLRERIAMEAVPEFQKTCAILKENPDILAVFDKEFHAAFGDKLEKLNALSEERRAKRKQFKCGELSKREWDAFCKQHNQEKSQVRSEQMLFRDAFIDRFMAPGSYNQSFRTYIELHAREQKI